MAGPIRLDALDPPLLEQTGYGPDQKRWLSNIVDIINSSFNSSNNTFGMLLASGQVDLNGSGAGPYTVTVTGLMSTNYVNASIVSTTNPGITIASVVAGSGSFTLTFSGDPGTHGIIVYQAFTSKPQ